MNHERPDNARKAPASAGAFLSIGGVAEATGLSVDTLRAWERRYGRPVAIRLPSGHRRYSDEQVHHLRRVAEAIAMGYRPSVLLSLSEAALDGILTPNTGDELDPRTEELLRFVHGFRRDELTAALRSDWGSLDPCTFLESRVATLLEVVGRSWTEGSLEIRHEHFLSEVIEDVLRSLRMGLPEASTTHAVVLATLPGERHDLGLQMLALLCALRGVAIQLLGPDTPVEQMVRTAREIGAGAVVVSVSLATGGVGAERLLAELRGQLPLEVDLLVGGSGSRGPRRGTRGVVYLEDLRSFTAWLDGFRRSRAVE